MEIITFELGPMKNLLYLGVCPKQKKAIMIDPAWEISPLLNYLDSNELSLEGILLTHGHHDHLNAVDSVLAFKKVPVYLSKNENPSFIPDSIDFTFIEDGNCISVGNSQIQCIATPGHSPGSMCFYTEGALITGDTLFVDGAGNCRFAGADASALYNSLHHKLLKLPGSTLIYPGHDYGPTKTSTLKEQQKSNPYLRLTSQADFIAYRMGI